MFAKLAVFSFLFVSSVSAAALPVRRAENNVFGPFNPFSIRNGTIVWLPKRDASDDAIGALRNMEIQYANNTEVVTQLESYVDDVVNGGNITEIMSSAQALVGSAKTSSNAAAAVDNVLVYNNAVLQLQYYASSTISQLQSAGNDDAVNTLLDDINTLASQVADGAINMNDAYNATLQDMNSLVSPTNAKRSIAAQDLNSGLFEIELLTSNAISLLQVAGQGAVVNTFVNAVNLLAADAQNGTISINDAVTETILNIAMALTANITNNATTNSSSPSKRTVDTDYIVTHLEFMSENAFQILNAVGKSDVADALDSQLNDLYNQAQNGTIAASDAFNAAVNSIATALTSNNVLAKRQTANDDLTNAVAIVQNLLQVTVNQLSSTGASSSLISQVTNTLNSMISQAQSGAINPLALISSARQYVDPILGWPL